VLHDPFCWDAMQRYMDCNSKMFLWVWRKKKKKKSTKRDNTGDPSTKTVGKRKRRPSQARKGPGDGEKGNKRPRNEKPGGETTGDRGGVVGDGADAGKGGGHAKLKTGDLLAQFYIQTEKKKEARKMNHWKKARRKLTSDTDNSMSSIPKGKKRKRKG